MHEREGKRDDIPLSRILKLHPFTPPLCAEAGFTITHLAREGKFHGFSAEGGVVAGKWVTYVCPTAL